MHPRHHPAAARLAIAALLACPCGLSVAADAPMYRCQQGDEVIFSQEPCGPDARAIDVQYDAPSAAEAAAADQAAAAAQSAAAAGVADIERTQRIEGLEREIRHLQAERDRAVNALAIERQQGTEERADATHGIELRGEMRATNDDYNARIEAREIELQQLLAQ
ncbi:hypothetical protein [Thiohalocapsa sp. ML1]|jgi:hypothetical protein|uniref:hypothetical protein n=1 Tax=Thiohalocapsa sp. ML1 TaxID=1431688 RepID=UPI0007320200|nr:hypothetical protein [Thiohalocapsa sp. ML1]